MSQPASRQYSRPQLGRATRGQGQEVRHVEGERVSRVCREDRLKRLHGADEILL